MKGRRSVLLVEVWKRQRAGLLLNKTSTASRVSNWILAASGEETSAERRIVWVQEGAQYRPLNTEWRSAGWPAFGFRHSMGGRVAKIAALGAAGTAAGRTNPVQFLN